MSQAFLESLNISDRVIISTFDKVKSVDQSSICLLGQVELPINFNGIQVQVMAHIIANSAHNIILGRASMDQFVQYIDYTRSKIELKQSHSKNV